MTKSEASTNKQETNVSYNTTTQPNNSNNNVIKTSRGKVSKPKKRTRKKHKRKHHHKRMYVGYYPGMNQPEKFVIYNPPQSHMNFRKSTRGKKHKKHNKEINTSTIQCSIFDYVLLCMVIGLGFYLIVNPIYKISKDGMVCKWGKYDNSNENVLICKEKSWYETDMVIDIITMDYDMNGYTGMQCSPITEDVGVLDMMYGYRITLSDIIGNITSLIERDNYKGITLMHMGIDYCGMVISLNTGEILFMANPVITSVSHETHQGRIDDILSGPGCEYKSSVDSWNTYTKKNEPTQYKYSNQLTLKWFDVNTGMHIIQTFTGNDAWTIDHMISILNGIWKC